MSNNVILNYAVDSCLYFCLPSTAACAQVCCLFALVRPVWPRVASNTQIRCGTKLQVRLAMANNVILNYAVASYLYFYLPGTAACAQVCCLFALARPVCGLEWHLILGTNSR
eukprot:g41938.t1